MSAVSAHTGCDGVTLPDVTVVHRTGSASRREELQHDGVVAPAGTSRMHSSVTSTSLRSACCALLVFDGNFCRDLGDANFCQ